MHCSEFPSPLSIIIDDDEMDLILQGRLDDTLVGWDTKYGFDVDCDVTTHVV